MKGSKVLRENLLAILTMAGVGAGVALGFGLRARESPWSPRDVLYVKYVGELFLRMLKALILPLIVSSLVAAVGSLDLSLSRKIGIRAIVYYMVTTIMAVVLGIILVTSIRPGRSGPPDDVVDVQARSRETTTADTLMDLVRNLVPPNLLEATMKTYQTVLIPPEDPVERNNTHKNDWRVKGEFSDGTNILGLVAFSVVLGVTLGGLKEKGKPLLDMFVALSEAMMVITGWVVWISPVGVCFLIAGQLVEEKDISERFKSLGLYFGTVMAGLIIHGLITLPIIYTVFTKKLPFRFLANMSQAMVTAFGTASSSATLPVTMECLESKNHVDPRVSRFVLPIGATINMDGTALYEAVAAIWIAQMHGKPMDVGSIIGISIASTAAAIGAAGIPQAGLVTMVMVLNIIGLPAEYVSYVVPVDWLLDRFRTMINVLGDSIGAGLVYHMSKADLDDIGSGASDTEESSPGDSRTDVSVIEHKHQQAFS
ncbi:excitatory amino acid transporter 3 [Folsomia candida]|uniref:Amino acid transporter n=1 Tax=Folsomia candida TaxID=158441 RepID=A0A226E7B6_FOLCA|nr:excitatory amino acid transporter 3 [Folsomia candida]OXA52781.1 Excitatory amino acid transporter 3 [Folsomia candida]